MHTPYIFTHNIVTFLFIKTTINVDRIIGRAMLAPI